MFSKINKEVFKRLFDDFRKSDDYDNRKSQLRFQEIAREIMIGLLKKEQISNDDLTALIQMFGAGCKTDNFLKYLKSLGFLKTKEEEIHKMFVETGECGFTGRGKSAIYGLNKNQLESVRVLLRNVFGAETISQVKEAVSSYEDIGVPQVTTGIYSPWLYYIKPTICPIIAGPATQFLYALGWDEYYISAMGFFQEINQTVDEVDLGFIDAFLWHGRWKEIVTNGDFVKNPIKDNKNSLILIKKQIILYGPPGTGKTYQTKDIALNLLNGEFTGEPREYAEQDEKTQRVWIFQANPSRYDLAGMLADPDYVKTSWNVAQYKNQINKGDTVLLWLSGEKSGIYAVGEITSAPFMELPPAEDMKYWRNNDDKRVERLAVRINITDNLVNNPILRDELRNIKGLENLSIFKFGQATNFPVDTDEWKILKQKIEERKS